MKKSTFFCLFALLTSLLLSACAPLGAAPTKSTTVKSAASSTSTLHEDEQQWEQGRAEYERDLDYSTIESLDEYKTKRALVESKYYLDLADMHLTYDRDKSTAVQYFKKSIAWLNQAVRMPTSANAKQSIETVKKDIMNMLNLAKKDAAGGVKWLPVQQREMLDSAVSQLETLIKEK